MSNSDALPSKGWNQLHPLHPDNLRCAKADAARMFDRLVVQYGIVTAHRIWNEAAARHSRPKAKGRPQGSRTRDHWLNPTDAHRTLHAIANDPENADLTRWQVFNLTATVLDAGHQQGLPTEANTKCSSLLAGVVVDSAGTIVDFKLEVFKAQSPTFEQWKKSQPKLNSKQCAERKKRIGAIRRLLERIQDKIDKQHKIVAQLHDDFQLPIEGDEVLPPSVKLLMAQMRNNALKALPLLPQESGSAHKNRKKGDVKKFL